MSTRGVLSPSHETKGEPEDVQSGPFQGPSPWEPRLSSHPPSAFLGIHKGRLTAGGLRVLRIPRLGPRLIPLKAALGSGQEPACTWRSLGRSLPA